MVGWKICIVEVKPTNLHSAIWSVCLTHLVSGPKSLRDEIWASQFCIKNRGSINEVMKCLKRLPPFLHFCGNIWHYNLKMGCNYFNAHYKYCYHCLYYCQYHYLTSKSLLSKNELLISLFCSYQQKSCAFSVSVFLQLCNDFIILKGHCPPE